MSATNAIQDLVRASAENGTGVTFITYVDGDEYTEKVTWADMLTSASAYAQALSESHGFTQGTKVAIVGATCRELVTAVEAVWVSGACVSMLPLPFRLNNLESFIEATKKRIASVGLELLIVDGLAAAFLDGHDFGVPVVALTDVDREAAALMSAGSVSVPEVQVPPEALAILQFTSGSTSEPKAVAVTYEVLDTNLQAISDHLRLTDPDHHKVVVSWLPLYHDMGLVGVLGGSMTRGTEAALASPQDFIAGPHRWMRWISEYGGTMTAGPNSAYALAARALNRSSDVLDLSSLEVAINGAEPVSPDAVRDLVEAGARHGMDSGAAFPVYGLAEVGIATSFPPVGRGLHVEFVHPEIFATRGYACRVPPSEGKEMVLLGRPFDCFDMQIVDPETRQVRGPRYVGEIWLAGPSVTPGYHANEEANRVSFDGDWFRTGDLGYVTEEGELVVTGRIKDVIIIGGRNYYPQDIELAASSVKAVRTGNVAAFGVTDEASRTEQVVVVAESRSADSGELRRSVKDAVAQACEVVPHKVVIVPAGTVPKTSSGKLQRAACREMFLEGNLAPVRD